MNPFDLLLPYRCPLCGAVSEPPGCRGCLAGLEAGSPRCVRCGSPLTEVPPYEEGGAAVVARCRACARRRFSFDSLVALGAYEGALAAAVRALKFKGDPHLARYLAALLGSRLDLLDLEGVAGVCYVPASRERMARHGFDQARLLAAGVARASGLPLLHLVRRVPWWRDPGRQTLFGGARRASAARAKFRLDGEGARSLAARAATHDAGIVLVDDVVTTGSTLNAIARLLKGAGVGRVLCAVVAVAADDGGRSRPVGAARRGIP